MGVDNAKIRVSGKGLTDWVSPGRVVPVRRMIMLVMGHDKMRKTSRLVISRNHKADADTTLDEMEKDARKLASMLKRNLPSATFDRLVRLLNNDHWKEYMGDRYGD